MDWRKILEEYGIDTSLEDEYSIQCPFHVDNISSCSINIDKGLWICFAGCGSGSLALFIQMLTGKSWQDINKELTPYKEDANFSFFPTVQNEQQTNQEITSPYVLYELTDDHWIYERDFTSDTLELWNCKQNLFGDLVIPVENEISQAIGWIKRRLFEEPKYLYNKGFKKSLCLFGINHIRNYETLYITEGALDAIWLNQNGYQGLSILGAIISVSQANLIGSLAPSEVVLCLDNDDAGQKGIKKATFDMKNRFLISYIDLPEKYKDIQDVRSKIELEDILENRHYF